MAKLSALYSKQIHASLQRFAPWTPNVPVALGDVGILVDGVFEHRTSLATLGIPFEAVRKTSGNVVDFTSAKGVTLEVSGAAVETKGPLTAKAHAKVTFSKAGGVVLQASNVSVTVMADPASVCGAVLTKFAEGGWEREWVFVTEVQSAGATTVMVSEGGEASIELTAEGAVGDQVPLSAGFVVSKKSGAVLNWVGRAGLTPLFGLSRVRQSVWDRIFGKKRGKITAARRAMPESVTAETIVEEVAVEAPPDVKRGELGAGKKPKK